MEDIILRQFIEEQKVDIPIWIYGIDEEDEFIIAHGIKNRLLDGVQLDKFELKYKVFNVKKYENYIVVHVKN